MARSAVISPPSPHSEIQCGGTALPDMLSAKAEIKIYVADYLEDLVVTHVQACFCSVFFMF